MEARAATLMVRYKAADGTWKRAKAARKANGKILPGFIILNGTAAKVKNFRYGIRYYVDRKVKYESAGTNAGEAETLRKRLEQQTTVKAEAAKAGVVVLDSGPRKTLAGSAGEYIADAESRGAAEAAIQARLVSSQFMATIKKIYVDEVTGKDVLHFLSVLARQRNGDRTRSNKFARLKSWLLFAGASKDIFPPRPKFEKKLPTTYTDDQISSILGSAEPYMTLVIKLALRCGLRDQEIMYLEWKDVDIKAKVIRVQGKVDLGFMVKDSEQREVPIIGDLLDDLQNWQADHPKTRLVVGTDQDHPNTHLLRSLKRLAKDAGLNCGHCSGCRGTTRECREWGLHRFRRTYATKLLRNGVDLRTVQALMGHADLDSSLRYLRPAESEELHEKLAKISW